MHMFNESTLFRQSIKLLQQKLCDYNSISINQFIKSHLQLQREITLIELAPIPYFFVKCIFLVYINMFNFQQLLFKILRKQNVTKRRTHKMKTVHRGGGINTLS